jgi:uncharacterized protein (TIGR04255 family)
MPTAEPNGPPVVELVIGVQFSPLTNLTSGHYGQFWSELGPEWDRSADQPLIEDRFELFDQPVWPGGVQLRLEPVRLPGRFLAYHRSGDRLVQVQPTRFHLNWRKRVGFYPSYTKLVGEFEAEYQRFERFVAGCGFGQVLPNQWELTYIDAFPKGDGWRTPGDWPDVLPGLFGRLFDAEGLGLGLERRTAEWSFELAPRRGRLYLAAGSGQWGPDECLLLTSTARGPVGGDGGTATVRHGLDLGHEAAVGAFRRLVAPGLQARWEG